MARKFSLWTLNRGVVENLLRNTIETYPNEWRLIHEPLQNAIDSFIDEKSARPISNLPKEPRVSIELRPGSDLTVIRDNGRGVPITHFEDFLILGGGTKGNATPLPARKLLKGSQGVGIKSTVFTSTHFLIRTVHSGQQWEKNLPGFSEYTDPKFHGEVEEPESRASSDPSGTSVEIRLQGYSVWDFLKERAAEFFQTVGLDNTKADAEGRIPIEDGSERKVGPFDLGRILMWYFKRESYAGCVSRAIGSPGLPDVLFELILNYDFPAAEQREFQIPGLLPLQAGKFTSIVDRVGYLDFSRALNQLQPRIRPAVVSDYRQLLEAGQKFDRPTVFYQVLKQDDIVHLLGTLRRRRPADPPGSTPYVLTANPEALEANRTAVERTNGGILFISSRPFQRTVLAHKSSITLSVNGLPTDISLEISGAALGYLPSVHFVLDVDETLGYGKRNLPSRSKGLYNLLAKDLWKNLWKIAEKVVAEEEERDWTLTGLLFDPRVETAAIVDPASAAGKALQECLGRTTIPRTEEDVVASYFYMAGKALVPRYGFVRLNDKTVYDAITTAVNPLSIPRPEELLTVEFKPSTLELCQSDEMGRQRFQDMQLGIVWGATEQTALPPGYTCVAKEADIGFAGYLPGANYRLKHDRHSVQIIALKDIFEDASRKPKQEAVAVG